MFPDNICQNIDILVVINVPKNNFGFNSNWKTQGQKHQLNNLYFKYQICQMKLGHLNTFLQFRLLFHERHCMACAKNTFLGNFQPRQYHTPADLIFLLFCKAYLIILFKFCLCIHLSLFMSHSAKFSTLSDTVRMHRCPIWLVIYSRVHATL